MYIAMKRNMKRFPYTLMIAAILCLNIGTGCAADTTDNGQFEFPSQKDPVDRPDEDVEDDGILKILAIGNSFSQNAVEQNLWELFDAAGIKAVIGNLYISGCSLETHYNNMRNDSPSYSYRKIENGSDKKTKQDKTTMQQGIQDENWDYICLQQVSGLSGIYSTYTQYLPGLIDYVIQESTNPAMKIAFHQTWAYPADSEHKDFPKYGNDQMTMFNAILDAARQTMTDYKSIEILIPAGTAIQNGRQSWLGDTFNSDGNHLNTTYGCYTAACTWFETFAGETVTGNAWIPENVTEAQAAVAQNAAHFAVESPYTINPMADFQTSE